jgi:hypothetical protein
MRQLLTIFLSAITLNLFAQVEISGTVINYNDSIFYNNPIYAIGKNAGDFNFSVFLHDTPSSVFINRDFFSPRPALDS